MLAEIQTAAVLHMYLEFMQVSPDKPPSDMARKMLKIATRGGASVLGWDKAGSIEPGQAADLTMFDIERLDFAGCVTDPLAALVLYASNHFADMTIVNGKVIVENGVLVDIDEGALIRRANELAHAYLKRIPAV
jgi:cytosine/adenosine deaminase-related metal-dependent hydrolase